MSPLACPSNDRKRGHLSGKRGTVVAVASVQHQMTNRESIQNQIAELVAAEPSPEETRSRALAQLLALAWWAKRQPANV